MSGGALWSAELTWMALCKWSRKNYYAKLLSYRRVLKARSLFFYFDRAQLLLRFQVHICFSYQSASPFIEKGLWVCLTLIKRPLKQRRDWRHPEQCSSFLCALLCVSTGPNQSTNCCGGSEQRCSLFRYSLLSVRNYIAESRPVKFSFKHLIENWIYQRD